MTKRRKSSKCPEPINTLLDIAGAAALGLYVKHKVKKDFEKGCGEESAKAAAMVFGMGNVKSYAQNQFWYLVEIYYRGRLAAPWLRFSGQGAKGQGRRYAARLALDPL